MSRLNQARHHFALITFQEFNKLICFVFKVWSSESASFRADNSSDRRGRSQSGEASRTQLYRLPLGEPRRHLLHHGPLKLHESSQS